MSPVLRRQEATMPRAGLSLPSPYPPLRRRAGLKTQAGLGKRAPRPQRNRKISPERKFQTYWQRAGDPFARAAAAEQVHRHGQEQKSWRSPSGCRRTCSGKTFCPGSGRSVANGGRGLHNIHKSRRREIKSKPYVRLADTFDECFPGKIGQMNLMAQLIGECYHARQNHQPNKYPADSCNHSQARLTVAGTECQK